MSLPWRNCGTRRVPVPEAGGLDPDTMTVSPEELGRTCERQPKRGEFNVLCSVFGSAERSAAEGGSRTWRVGNLPSPPPPPPPPPFLALSLSSHLSVSLAPPAPPLAFSLSPLAYLSLWLNSEHARRVNAPSLTSDQPTNLSILPTYLPIYLLIVTYSPAPPSRCGPRGISNWWIEPRPLAPADPIRPDSIRARGQADVGHGRLDRPRREIGWGKKEERNGDNSVRLYRRDQPQRPRSLIQLNRFARNELFARRAAGHGGGGPGNRRGGYHTGRSFYLEKEYRTAGHRLTASWVSLGRISWNLVPGLLSERAEVPCTGWPCKSPDMFPS